MPPRQYFTAGVFLLRKSAAAAATAVVVIVVSAATAVVVIVVSAATAVVTVAAANPYDNEKNDDPARRIVASTVKSAHSNVLL